MIKEFLAARQEPVDDLEDIIPVRRWARAGLATKQVARSVWKEAPIPAERLRVARNVKVCSKLLQNANELLIVNYSFVTTRRLDMARSATIRSYLLSMM